MTSFAGASLPTVTNLASCSAMLPVTISRVLSTKVSDRVAGAHEVAELDTGRSWITPSNGARITM